MMVKEERRKIYLLSPNFHDTNFARQHLLPKLLGCICMDANWVLSHLMPQYY